MYSVNLNTVQDNLQFSVKKNESNSNGISGSGQKDFLSLLNENLSRLDEVRENPSAKSESSVEIYSEKTERTFADNKSVENEKKSKEDKSSENSSVSKDEKSERKEISDNGGTSVSEKKNLSVKNTKKPDSEKTDFMQKSDSEQEVPLENFQCMQNISEARKAFDLAGKDSVQSVKKSREKDFSETPLSANEILSAMHSRFSRTAPDKSGAGTDSKNHEKSRSSVSSVQKKSDKKIGVIEVKDLRTKAADEVKDVKKDFIRMVQKDSDGNTRITMDLGVHSEQNILSLDAQSASAEGSSFQAMLKNQITQNAGELVRAGNIILKDNNTGSINLLLHPEQLGNVRISLELTGKVVTGHIIVASREALNAFGDGADVLRNAFVQSGFEDARFDVSYGGSEMQFAQQGSGGREDSQFAGRKIYSDFVEENISAISQNADSNTDGFSAGRTDYSVDLVA